MYYDDHSYCEICAKHDQGCWCFENRPPDLLEEDLAEDREIGRLCEGHGPLLVVTPQYRRGMDWARRAGLSRKEFRVITGSADLLGVGSPDELVLLGSPDLRTDDEVRVLRACGVKVWHVS